MDMQECKYIDTQLLSGMEPNPKIISCNGIYICDENCFNDYSFYDLFTSQIPFDIYLSVSYINIFEIIEERM